MYKTVLENIVKPALTRTGTMLSGVLIGWGVQSDHASAIAIGATTLLLVGLDFAGSYINRKSIEHKAAQAATHG